MDDHRPPFRRTTPELQAPQRHAGERLRPVPGARTAAPVLFEKVANQRVVVGTEPLENQGRQEWGPSHQETPFSSGMPFHSATKAR